MAGSQSLGVHNVKTLELPSTNDFTVFAVMGTTGSGKSTFVQKLTGNPDVVVGHSLKACTQEPHLFEFSYGDRQMAILDTPGFDDTYRTDTDVLQGIAQFLVGTYQKNIRLSGIIYLHRITDPRLGHEGLANLGLFRALCGDEPMKKVVLATTFWEVMTNEERAREHEEELRSTPEYWGDMLIKNATMTQFHDTQESAFAIVESLLHNEEKITLKIQREMVDQKLDLIDTTAGEALKRELTKTIAIYEAKIEKLKTDVDAAFKARDDELQEVKTTQAKRVEEAKRTYVMQIDKLQAKNREQLRQQGMDFDMRFLALTREDKVDPDQTQEEPVIEIEPEATTKPSINTQLPLAMTPQQLLEKKRAKRDKILQIAGALGATATAAGIAVINPIAIPVAFSGLISLINACFLSRDAKQLKRLEEDGAINST